MMALIILLVFFGCNVTKKTTQETTTIASATTKVDSVAVRDSSSVKRDAATTKVRYDYQKIDTIPGEDVAIDLSDAELEPVTDVNGDTVGRTFTKRAGHITASVTVNKNGTINVRCKEDSLRYVVSRYVLDSVHTREVIDSFRKVNEAAIQQYRTDSAAVVQSRTEVVKEKNSGWFARLWQWVKNIFALVGLAWFIVFIIKKVRRGTIGV